MRRRSNKRNSHQRPGSAHGQQYVAGDGENASYNCICRQCKWHEICLRYQLCKWSTAAQAMLLQTKSQRIKRNQLQHDMAQEMLARQRGHAAAAAVPLQTRMRLH